MKKILLVIFSLTMLNAVSYADKIIITGKPVILEKRKDVYYLSNAYKSTKSYYYVIVDGVRKVCYIDKQPELSALDTLILDVNYMGSTLSWVCYPFDTNYFRTP